MNHPDLHQAVIRLIRAGDTETNIRRRYPMSDALWAELRGMA